jgi:glycosyltransferase involved in cell wall biosynthesis
LAGNRNTGFLAATGEIVGSCDDDDEWLQGKLRAQVTLFLAHPEASAVACGFFYSFRGQDTARVAPKPVLSFQDFLEDRHLEANSSTYLMRLDTLRNRVGLLDEDLPGSYAEDYELMLRAARLGPVVCLREVYARVFLHDSSFFASAWQTMNDSLLYLLGRVPEIQGSAVGRARIQGQLAFANAALGNRKVAARYALHSLASSRRARQSYAALLVASGLVSADRMLSLSRRFGRGI